MLSGCESILLSGCDVITEVIGNFQEHYDIWKSSVCFNAGQCLLSVDMFRHLDGWGITLFDTKYDGVMFGKGCDNCACDELFIKYSRWFSVLDDRSDITVHGHAQQAKSFRNNKTCNSGFSINCIRKLHPQVRCVKYSPSWETAQKT